MSLGSGLKVRLNQKGKFNLDEEYPQPHDEVCEITQIINCGDHFEYEISDGNVSYGFIEEDEFDIIARPLSDLTKEIDGTPAFFRYYESYSPIKKQLANLAYGIGDIDDVPFHVVIRMIKEHFDIAGLIEKGEAIDINTIENPYK